SPADPGPPPAAAPTHGFATSTPPPREGSPPTRPRPAHPPAPAAPARPAAATAPPAAAPRRSGPPGAAPPPATAPARNTTPLRVHPVASPPHRPPRNSAITAGRTRTHSHSFARVATASRRQHRGSALFLTLIPGLVQLTAHA